MTIEPILYFYLAAGLLGSAMRLLKRHGTEGGAINWALAIPEIVAGGVGGLLLPYIGGLVIPGQIQSVTDQLPALAKAAAVFGSTFALGHVFNRWERPNGGK